MGDRALSELAAAIAAEQKAAWDDFWKERIDLQALSHRCREVLGEACVRPREVVARHEAGRGERPSGRAPGPAGGPRAIVDLSRPPGPRTVADLPSAEEVYARRARQAAAPAEES